MLFPIIKQTCWLILCKVQCSVLEGKFWPSGSRIFPPERFLWTTVNDRNFFGQGSLIFECITGHFRGKYVLILTVHSVLEYSTAFGSSLLQEEFLISSGLRHIPMCGVRTLPISLIHMKPIYMGGRENIAQLIKVLWPSVQARIWHFSTSIDGTLSGDYLLALLPRQKTL